MDASTGSVLFEADEDNLLSDWYDLGSGLLQIQNPTKRYVTIPIGNNTNRNITVPRKTA